MFKLKNIKIGKKYPPIIFTELEFNHEGSLDKAIFLADKALNSGARIIKHQTHIPDEEMALQAKKIKPGNANSSIFNVIKKNSLNFRDEKKLMNYINKKGGIFISTPFCKAAVDRLIKFNVPLFKIGSGECNNYPLVEYICKKKKPVIMSTGMNDIRSITPSVKLFRKYKIPFVLLHCTNIYPTDHKLVRLQAMSQIQKSFPDAIIGLSDHTEGIYTCLGAVSLGAKVIEKHFTDDKKSRGPDMSCSMDPNELKELIDGSKIIYEALEGKKAPLKEEKKTIAFAFASVATTKNIKKNDILTTENIFL
jgi:Sialic acid synthase